MANSKYAVVNVFGRQFKVKEGDKIEANFCDAEIGKEMTFGEVYMLNTGTDVKVGAPLVAGAKVTATLDSQKRAPKILVFKYLNKNHLKKTVGHKQPYSVLKITKIEG